MYSPEVNTLHEELTTILQKEASPDTVDSFADEILHDVVTVRDKATRYFLSHMAVRSYLNQRQLEEDAFKSLELPSVDELLDSAAKIAYELPLINHVLQNCQIEDFVYLPPDDISISGDEKRAKNREIKTSNKTKTALLLLAKDFGVDLSDDLQFAISTGAVDEGMVRSQPYRLLIAHELERAVLVCDEVENITYVLNTGVIKENGDHIASFKHMKKSEIDSYLSNHTLAGQRVIENKHYTANLREAIERPFHKPTPQDIEHGKVATTHLSDNEVMSIADVRRKLHIHDKSLKKILGELSIAVDTRTLYGRPTHTIPASSFQDIRQHPISATPHAEDYDALSLESLRKEIGVGRSTLDLICSELGIQIGEYKLGKRLKIGAGILESDLGRILEHPLLENSKKDEAHISVAEFAKQHGTTVPILNKALEKLGIETQKMKSGKHTADVFSIVHESQVKSEINSDVPIGSDYEAISAREFEEMHGISNATLEKTINELGIQTGYYKFGSKINKGLLPNDVAIISSHPSIALPKADETIIKINDALDKLCIARSTLFEVAQQHGIKIKTYRYAKTKGYGLTKEEYDILRQDLQIATPHAEDYDAISLNTARYALGTTRIEALRLIRENGIQTGQFKFGPNYELGILSSDFEALKTQK